MTPLQKQIEQRVADFAAACRRQGIKATHQRLEILRELAATGAHPDAETIFRRVRRRLPSISLDTVYRTLRMLEEKSVIARVPSMKDRARFDANMDRHHHFVCAVCGRIDDFYSAALDGFVPPPGVGTMGTVESVHVELRGRCNACAGQAARKG
jgi:Fur family transcriptional regulator, peroxide stress response regulator